MTLREELDLIAKQIVEVVDGKGPVSLIVGYLSQVYMMGQMDATLPTWGSNEGTVEAPNSSGGEVKTS